ncbi:MAG: ATP synthase F1 subunit gamma [Deltaproteobacteria bacterium]|nr:MAG: ATP synthase F1 subunit gamma [Deltaproteobacteria bacterium]
MVSLQFIRNRIKSINNTEKITKAMKVIAASKFRQSQLHIQAANSYHQSLKDCMASSLSFIQNVKQTNLPIFFADSPESSEYNSVVEIFIFTSDRGLCGSFNSSIIKEYLKNNISNHNPKIKIIGLKGAESLNRLQISNYKYSNFANTLNEKSFSNFRESIYNFLNFKTKELYFFYTHFVTAFKQEIVLKKILPLNLNDFNNPKNKVEIQDSSIHENLNFLLSQYLLNEFYLAMSNSLTSESCARMNAMDNANRNAKELIKKLTLHYNQARQSSITKEILEIISGAESINVDQE